MRTMCQFSRMARFALCGLMGFALGAAPGCNQPGNGNNSNAVDNDNGDNGNNSNTGDNGNNDNSGGGIPTPDDMFVQPDNRQGTLRVGQAQAGEATEYGMFGNKSGNGTPLDIREIDVILADQASTPARILLDENALPLSIITGDSASFQIVYEDLGDTVSIQGRFVDFTGIASLVTVDADIDIVDPGVPDFSDLCDYFDTLLEVTGALTDDCDDGDDDRFCNSTVARVIDAMELFCTLDTVLVSNLPPGLGSAPPLDLPLGVFAEVDQVISPPNQVIALQAFAQGGVPPYSFNWTISDGPETTPITVVPGGVVSSAELSLALVGDYVLSILLFDDTTAVSIFNVEISIQTEPDALLVNASSEGTVDPFVYDLNSTTIGGIQPYSYLWSVVETPDGADVNFDSATSADTPATFSAGGLYTVQVQASDSGGAVSVAQTDIRVVDPETSLLADIQFPACNVVCDATAGPVETDEDTCLEIQNTMRLTADPLNVESCSMDDASDFSCLQYRWRIIAGQNSGILNDPSEQIATLLAVGPETITVELEIIDPRDGQTDTTSITVEVIECGRLNITVLTAGSLEEGCDTDATLNSPVLLRTVTSGFIGLLSYEWAVVSGSGEFDDPKGDCSSADGPCCLDDDSCQNVNFTPTTLDTVEIRVTVTDSSTTNTDSDSANVCASTFTVAIDGPQAACGSDDNPCEINNNQTSVFTAVPSSDAPANVVYTWTIIEGDETPEGSCVYIIEDEDLELQLFDCAAQELTILPQGNGPFRLVVEAEQASDATNDTFAQALVMSVCVPPDDPSAIGSAESDNESGSGIVAQEGDEVLLNCLVDSLLNRNINWERLDTIDVQFAISPPETRDSDLDGVNDAVDLCPNTPLAAAVNEFGCSQQQGVNPANFIYTSIFEMPDSLNGIVGPLEFECHNVNPGSRCDIRSTTVEVYFDESPEVAPTDATDEQTVQVGTEVTVVCEQLSGSQVRRFDWQQVLGDFVSIETTGNGTMTFIAPASAQTLEFECRGVVLGPDGTELLVGDFNNDDSAVITVEN